jgi:hypothetical protein
MNNDQVMIALLLPAYPMHVHEIHVMGKDRGVLSAASSNHLAEQRDQWSEAPADVVLRGRCGTCVGNIRRAATALFNYFHKTKNR